MTALKKIFLGFVPVFETLQQQQPRTKTTTKKIVFVRKKFMIKLCVSTHFSFLNV